MENKTFKGIFCVTGKPRCGTSMMMYCLHKAGVPLAFDDMKNNEEVMKRYKNPYGFFEGRWNGQDGLLKCFSPNMFEQFPNPRLVVMTRDEKKIQASWKEVRKDLPQRVAPVMTEEKKAEMQKRMKEMKEKQVFRPKFITLSDALKKYPHITVDYDTFVTNPEQYRKDFEGLFPELDFDIIKSGVDKSLYINR